jgi:hypothetical protein
VIPEGNHYRVGAEVFGIGLGITAYTFGSRHAFDADHIAAIDNTTRKLTAEGPTIVDIASTRPDTVARPHRNLTGFRTAHRNGGNATRAFSVLIPGGVIGHAL